MVIGITANNDFQSDTIVIILVIITNIYENTTHRFVK